MPYTLVSREEWGAVPPSRQATDLKKPISKVIMTKTKTPACNSDEECKLHMRKLQKFHMDRGEEDIPYSFIVTPDCKIYEGRGWNKSVPVPKERPELKNKALVVGHIGEFTEDDERRREMVRTHFDLLDEGMDKKLIDWDFHHAEIYSYIDNSGIAFNELEDKTVN